MTRHPAPRPGITLIEVMLALAILLFALVAIGQLVDIGIDRGNDARANTRGARLAQSKMAEAEAGAVDLTSAASGTFEGDDAAWQYTVTPEAAGPPNLYVVTVRVSRGADSRPHEVVLKQMVFDPTLTGSAAQAERPPAPDAAEDPDAGGMP